MKPFSLLVTALMAQALSVSPLKADESTAIVYEVKVPGMKCVGCSFSVTEELKKLDHVNEVYVDVKSKTAVVAVESETAPGEKALFSAVKTAGYEATACTRLTVKFSEAKAALTGAKG